MALNPVNLETGAEQKAADFINRLEGFKKQSLNQVAETSQARGTEQAMSDATEGEGEFRTNFGVSNKAYNSTLKSAYMASAKSDLSESMSAAAAQHPNDLQAFNDATDELVKSTVRSADPMIADELALNADIMSSQFRKQVQGNAIKANLEAAAAEQQRSKQVISDNALGMLANAKTDEDVAAAAQQMSEAMKVIADQKEAGQITEERAAKESTFLAKGFAEQSFLNTVDNAPTLDEAYDNLEALYDKVPTGWSPKDWNSVLSKAQQSVNRRARQEAEEIDAMAEVNKYQSLVSHGAALFESGYPIDPNKTTDESKYNLEAINSYYDQVSQEWAGLPLNEQINNNVAFVAKSGVLPLQVESRLNAFSRSGSVDQARIAAETASRIQETSPQSLRDMPAETKAILMAVSDSLKSGTDPEIALEVARKSAYGMTQAKRDEIGVKSKEYSKDLSSNLQKMLDKNPDEGGFDKWNTYGAPDAPPAMAAEFKVSFDKYMVLTDGDSSQSEKLAYADTKTMWSPSNVTGQFMKYAPEAFYSVPGVGNEWIGEQFKADTVDIEGATISVLPSTTRSERPEYGLLAPDENGIMQPVYDDSGMPQAWTPDFRETEQYKDFQAQPGEEMAAAKKQRQAHVTQKFNKQVGLIRSKTFLQKDKDYENAINNAILADEITEVDAAKLMEYFDAN